jgi:hypothetical protein
MNHLFMRSMIGRGVAAGTMAADRPVMWMDGKLVVTTAC